jgi:hypothetical protein
MRKIILLLFCALTLSTFGQFKNDTIALAKIYEEVLLHSTCYDELNYLDTVLQDLLLPKAPLIGENKGLNLWVLIPVTSCL